MKKNLLKYDKEAAAALLKRIFPNDDNQFIELTKEITRHLPKTYDNKYCIAFTQKIKDETVKFIIYFGEDYGQVTKGPGMYSSYSPIDVLAKEINLAFHLKK